MSNSAGTNSTGADAVRWALGLLIATALAVWFGDRVGFEGDDLAIIAGSAHFDLRPLDSLYRYPWQSLSYFVAHALIRGGVTPLSIEWLTHILSAIGLVFLAETLRGILRMPGRTLIAYGSILAIPELWVTALYFSTTAAGLPFFTGALLLLFTATDNEKSWSWKVVAAAAAFAVACLFRFDFATAAIAMLLIVYERTPQRKWRGVFLFVAVAAAVGLSILLVLRLNPLDILKGAGQLEESLWEQWRSMLVLALAMLPMLAMSPFLALELRRRDWPRKPVVHWAVIAVAALAVLTPLKSLYSGKYLVPAFCLFLIVLALLLQRPPVRRAASDATAVLPFQPLTVWACSAILVVIYCVGVHVDKVARRASVTLLLASNFSTHDGPRPLGAYLGLLPQMKDPEQRPAYVSLNRYLAQKILQAPGNSTAVFIENYHGPDSEWSAPLANNWTWGWPALYLQEQGWKVESYAVKERVVVRAPDGRRAEILVKEQPTDVGTSGDCVLVAGPARFGEYEDLERVAEQIKQASCAR